jgi:hypothetical protein
MNELDWFDGNLFDPVTLGLHVPSSILHDRPVSDSPAKDHASGVFVHELTHYLQFHGSLFGYNYLFHSQFKTHFFIKFLRHISQKTRLTLPVAYRYPVDIANLTDFLPDEDHTLFLQTLHSERYFQEELYGWTYPYLATQPLYDDSGCVRESSILNLRMHEAGSTLPITGECILENHAMICEILHVHAIAKENADNLLNECYGHVDPLRRAKYFAINDYFGIFKIWKLAPVFYFIILNQPLHNISLEHGNYNLVVNLKKILFRHLDFLDLDLPITAVGLQQVVELVCKECQLTNPYHALEELRGYLNALCQHPQSPNYVTNWVALRIVEWILNNRLDAIWWPLRPMSVLNSIPILNLYSAPSSNMPFRLNIPDAMEERVKTYLGHCTVRHMIDSIMRKEAIRCPAWIYRDSKPNLVAECSACSGNVLSRNDHSACPALRVLHDLKISNIVRSDA